MRLELDGVMVWLLMEAEMVSRTRLLSQMNRMEAWSVRSRLLFAETLQSHCEPCGVHRSVFSEMSVPMLEVALSVTVASVLERLERVMSQKPMWLSVSFRALVMATSKSSGLCWDCRGTVESGMTGEEVGSGV